MATRSDDNQGTAYLKQIAATRRAAGNPEMLGGNLLGALKKRNTTPKDPATRTVAQALELMPLADTIVDAFAKTVSVVGRPEDSMSEIATMTETVAELFGCDLETLKLATRIAMRTKTGLTTSQALATL